MNEKNTLGLNNCFLDLSDPFELFGKWFEEAKKSGDYSDEQINQAYEYMLLAEGSDWFWWYGLDQDSTVDYYFDQAFKDLLRMVYLSLGLEEPGF